MPERSCWTTADPHCRIFEAMPRRVWPTPSIYSCCRSTSRWSRPPILPKWPRALRPRLDNHHSMMFSVTEHSRDYGFEVPARQVDLDDRPFAADEDVRWDIRDSVGAGIVALP